MQTYTIMRRISTNVIMWPQVWPSSSWKKYECFYSLITKLQFSILSLKGTLYSQKSKQNHVPLPINQLINRTASGTFSWEITSGNFLVDIFFWRVDLCDVAHNKFRDAKNCNVKTFILRCGMRL